MITGAPMSVAAVVLLVAAASPPVDSTSAPAPLAVGAASAAAKAYIVVFDFAAAGQDAAIGRELADSVRLRLARHDDCEVIDGLTTQQFSAPLPVTTDAGTVEALMSKLAASVAVWGTMSRQGEAMSAAVRCLDLTDPSARREWTRSFSADGQRARAVIAGEIVEAIRNQAEWRPPEYGEETEPAQFGRPLNVNGGFEQGHIGWEAPDNVATFIAAGPPARGKVLRIRTDLDRDPWLAYRRALMLGQAEANDPPAIPTDTSYQSLAAMEGVHFCSDWIKAAPGHRYWLTADVKCGRGGGEPKVFVKGFTDMAESADGLSERSLAELKLSPQEFAALPPQRRTQIIAKDAAEHPERYRREVYRWYLPCRGGSEWAHFAAPFPPRGPIGSPPGAKSREVGLPANVQWVQIQVFASWPPGEYLLDNVMLYADPRQQAPLPQEPARATLPATQ